MPANGCFVVCSFETTQISGCLPIGPIVRWLGVCANRMRCPNERSLLVFTFSVLTLWLQCCDSDWTASARTSGRVLLLSRGVLLMHRLQHTVVHCGEFTDNLIVHKLSYCLLLFWPRISGELVEALPTWFPSAPFTLILWSLASAASSSSLRLRVLLCQALLPVRSRLLAGFLSFCWGSSGDLWVPDRTVPPNTRGNMTCFKIFAGLFLVFLIL